MKYLFLLLFASFMLALPTALDAQCPVGNVTLNSQAEVDNFAVSYPNCSQISGSLTIEGSDITDLQGLNNLSSVGTFLLIRGNGALTSLQGLNNLSSVGNNLFILVNAALTSLQGLDNLSSVGSNIYIGSNDALTSLQGLDNLSSVGNEIAIRYNDALASLQGLDNLSSVGNDIFIIDNDALTSLQGLSSLSSLVGDLQIEENDALTSLNGPNMLTSIGGTLWIGRNDALTSLDGLNNISSVGDDLLIQYNNTLTSLNGLGNLSSVASFIIIGTNPALTSLNGLESLSSVGTDISIVLNESLTSITSLNNLSSLGGRLEIRGNNALTSIAGLSSLTSLDRLLIADNEALTSLQGLNNIASIASDLRIENNDTLTSIQALNNLSSVGGELRITDNTTLSTCSIDWICDSIYFPYQIMIISNNATGCNSKAEVEDDCPNLYEPVCQDATIALLFDGTASITPSEVDGGSIDVASSFVFPSDFTCKELGANIVSLVVIDIAGNIGACDATVTVEDPNNFCPDCTTYTATDTPQPVPVFGSGAFDCSSATTSTVDVDIPGQIGLGATRIDYLEMDITHTFNADLVITLIAPSGADIVLSVYGGGQNYTNTRFEDGFPSINSANAPFTGTFEPEEGAFNDVLAGEDVQGTWTLYVCDFGDGDIGTLNSFTLKICSSGYPAPPSITCPPDQTGSFNTNCQFSIPDYRSLATASSSTGSSPTITQSPAPGTQINGSGGSLNQLITLTVTDAVGNSSDCTFNLTVNDGTPPTISCPADITQTVDPGQTYATVINIAPVSSDDNCASPTITHAISGATTGSGGADASNTQFNIGSSVVTYTVTDAAGLIGNCSFTVDVTLDCGSILVNSTADNLTSGDGNCTLREAIRNVNAGSDLTSGDCNCGTTITFDASTNGTPIVLSLTGAGEDAAATGDLDITADVTITGNGSGNTIINGNNTDRVFHLTASSLNVTLEHLTVKDGLLTGSNSGGGLNSGSNNANLIISNCAFDSNQASSGGGLRIQNASTVEIDNCLFNGNIAYGPYGGGVSLSIGTYTIRNCSFQNNQTNTFGGGAYTTSGSYTFINCTMTGNTANNSGGAISNGFVGGVVKLTNCTIAKNTSPNGAAVDINNSSSFLSLTNNIIVNNISPSDLNIGGLFIQVNVQNIVESCSGSCPTFFSTSDDVICGLSTCANGLGYYPVIPNSDADGTADTSTPLADDICGNIRSASSYNIGSSEVFFTDNENPVVVCPATQTISNDAGECGANVSFTVPDPTDNCSATSSASPASGSFFNVGTTQVTVTATDGTGNTSQCTFDVIVNDTENPTISCPADVTQTVDAGQTYATVINIAPVSSDDNCASPTITHAISGVTTGSGGSDASGTQFNIGSSVVTYTIEDASNNTATCSFNVEVNGNAEIDVQDPDMNSLTNNASNYDFGNVDIMGGSASGTFTINNIGDIALLLDGSPTVAISGSASFSVTQPSSTTIAPAGATAFQIDYNPANEDCSQQMATISISNNDPDETPFVFTVSATPVDNVNPTANCPSNITQSNDTGQCGANVSFSIPAPSDNCPGVSAVASPASGFFFDVGTTSVTVIATDASNNTGSCTFTVTVTDTEDPSINCPADITVDNDSGLCSAVVNIPAPTVSDNCPGASFEYAPASGSAFDVGTTTVTATATDGAGNTATCTLNVTVNDTEDPAINCPADITVAATSGAGAVVDYTAPAGTDNCTPATMQTAGLASGATFPIGTTTNTFEVTDGAGNTSSCSFNITVDDVALDINCPADITVSNDQGECSAVVAFEATETTGIPPSTITYSQDPGTAFPVGNTTVTATATNSQGSDQCSFTVTVTDTEDPSITCPADITVDNDSGLCSAVVSIPTPTVADNCPGASFEYAPASGSAFDTGTTTVTATATDGAGNTATCTLNVTVNDTE
ncbi:HYR domain-containing protein, partial [Phaeodactylibacter sp.]|uniref:HYR domain-containing protein n=1 Tax=Phaeodactylibacter sp. TaxID=1940289 RepID=UPI0025FA1F33